jgi:nitroreductase
MHLAVQDIILACRGFRLGTVITTDHIRCKDEVKALLGIPEDVSTSALMPIGWPMDKFGPLTPSTARRSRPHRSLGQPLGFAAPSRQGPER